MVHDPIYIKLLFAKQLKHSTEAELTTDQDSLGADQFTIESWYENLKDLPNLKRIKKYVGND